MKYPPVCSPTDFVEKMSQIPPSHLLERAPDMAKRTSEDGTHVTLAVASVVEPMLPSTRSISCAASYHSLRRPPTMANGPFKLELMQEMKVVWTLPESPATGPFLETVLPEFEPPDGVYHLRATSLLHHQASAISEPFEVHTRLEASDFPP